MPRFLEIFLSLVGLVLFSPVFIVIALFVRLDSKGPIFFHPLRIGLNGELFRMVKFRTMASGTAGQGPPITVKTDPRITRVGAFLRKEKLDELPQLFNVLKGNMGFVGPRPEDPVIAEKYPDNFRSIFRFRPGITSPASLEFQSEEEMIPADRWEPVYFGDILPKKVKMDVRYMENATFWSDMRVIFQTVFK